MSLKRLFETLFLAVSGLIVSLALSWLILSSVNFSYGLWHDVGGIAEAIEKYGPKNNFKHGFHLTTKEQRELLFRDINISIHNHGEGLADISYSVEGLGEQTLLREPEIVHLQDVANLIDVGLVVAVVGFLIWFGTWCYLALARESVPKLIEQCIAIAGILGLGGLITVIIGPVKVFYWLHTVIFPDNHQWFFYYQESLMSTMMYAPNLFGYIAVEWLIFAFAVFVLLQGVSLKAVKLFWMGR